MSGISICKMWRRPLLLRECRDLDWKPASLSQRNVESVGGSRSQTRPGPARRAAIYWADQASAVEVEVDLPTSHRGMIRMADNFQGCFVGQLRRKAAEVSERRLTPSEQEEFRAAKEIEIKNFLSADAFEALPAHLQPNKDQAVGMRWILTWKLRDDGSRKAKARTVLLGYMDPCYEHRCTAAPVMTRQSRQMHLQMAAWKRWKIRKGDVSGAFLQGREYPDTLYCTPTKEICEAMNIPENSICMG